MWMITWLAPQVPLVPGLAAARIIMIGSAVIIFGHKIYGPIGPL